jgi:hypothetical protein
MSGGLIFQFEPELVSPPKHHSYMPLTYRITSPTTGLRQIVAAKG